MKPPKDSTISDVMRHLASRRQTFAGGRPRGKSKRCPCGVMTLKRAQTRGRSTEHETHCTFYPSK